MSLWDVGTDDLFLGLAFLDFMSSADRERVRVVPCSQAKTIYREVCTCVLLG